MTLPYLIYATFHCYFRLVLLNCSTPFFSFFYIFVISSCKVVLIVLLNEVLLMQTKLLVAVHELGTNLPSISAFP